MKNFKWGMTAWASLADLPRRPRNRKEAFAKMKRDGLM